MTGRRLYDALTDAWGADTQAWDSRLSDAEYAYVVQRGGEDYFERGYGIEYQR